MSDHMIPCHLCTFELQRPKCLPSHKKTIRCSITCWRYFYLFSTFPCDRYRKGHDFFNHLNYGCKRTRAEDSGQTSRESTIWCVSPCSLSFSHLIAGRLEKTVAFSFLMMVASWNETLAITKALNRDILSKKHSHIAFVIVNHWLLRHSNRLFRTKITVAKRAWRNHFGTL